MKSITCPICDRRNSAVAPRCSACGADFDDPDVRALMGDGAPPADAPLSSAQSLASSKFLGISIDELVRGTTTSRLAIVGALGLIAGFLIPLGLEFHGESVGLRGGMLERGQSQFAMAWSALDSGPVFSLLYAPLAAIFALALGFAGKLDPWKRAAILMPLGIGGLLTLSRLSIYGGSASAMLPVYLVGLVIASVALIIRLTDPGSNDARKMLIGGAVLAIVGLLIPVADSSRVLLLEVEMYTVSDSSVPLSVYLAAVNRDPITFFASLYNLLPLFLLPLAAIIAWPKPTGLWDQTGLILRPIAWLIVLLVPAGMALAAVNVMGWNLDYARFENAYVDFDTVSSALIVGRLRLLVLASVFALWASLGGVVLYRHFRGETPANVHPQPDTPQP